VTGDELDRAFLDGLEQLGPFGEGNPEPLLLMPGVMPTECRVLKGRHLRLDFRTAHGRPLSAIVFDRADELLGRVARGVPADLCVRAVRDTYQRRPGEHGVGFHLVDLRPAGVAS
jgi:single-stranded-DNA-specific exonuclease